MKNIHCNLNLTHVRLEYFVVTILKDIKLKNNALIKYNLCRGSGSNIGHLLLINQILILS